MGKNLLRFFVLAAVLVTQGVFAQSKSITGQVTEANGEPMPGATIIVLGTQNGTSTDFDGNFSLTVRQGDRLEISYVGYSTKIVTVGTANSYPIVLDEDSSILDEVLVVAYGTASKESITGSIASIDSRTIEKRTVSNALGVLEGAAAGVQINNTVGQPGSEPSVRIRGFTTINGSNSPLYVVDGVPFGGNISDINPADIESISVLKDASASTLYGNRASNGVIMIKTKSGKGKGGMNVSIRQGVYNRGTSEYDKVGPNDFMEVMWKGYRNSLLTGNPSMSIADANAKASSSLVEDYLKMNIYNVSDDNLFTSDGSLNPNAQVLDGYRDDLDWFDPLERTGFRQEYNVSARNTNDKGGVYYSAGYMDEEGYLKNSDFNRFNARINADYQANEWLKYGSTLR